MQCVHKVYSFVFARKRESNNERGHTPLPAQQALKTKESVVIKMRNKSRSFKDEQEINDWVANMKLLYHLREKKNPHIAKVLDIIEDQSNYYVVMEHVQGTASCSSNY